MTHMYFSARAEGRLSYGHLGRTNSCFFLLVSITSYDLHASINFHRLKLEHSNFKSTAVKTSLVQFNLEESAEERIASSIQPRISISKSILQRLECGM